MTSTTVGLPDRYRPLEQVGADEATDTGVISTWRAKDRVLNRDVAVRVHTPGGAAARAWIARALTAGGLATPALAMVYDASEGTADPQNGGGIAYVVNEWIDGESLEERLSRGPLPDREARTVLRRLAEGVAEAHRVGLAVGGLTPDNVVLRPNGLVGLRGVPAATGTVEGDVTALGRLLEFCLTGSTDDDGAARPRPGLAPDLAALVRRARSDEPGQGLTSAAAMASLLVERPRSVTGRSGDAPRGPDSDGGRLRRLRRTDVEESPVRAAPDAVAAPTVAADVPGSPQQLAANDARARQDAQQEAPPRQPVPRHAANEHPPTGKVPPTRPAVPLPDGGWGAYTGGPTGDHVLGDGLLADEAVDDHEPAGLESPTARRRLVVYGVPILALALVIGVAVWLGTSVLSVASSVGQVKGSTPSVPATSASGSTAARTSAPAPAAGADVPIVGATVYDPDGDGEPENTRQVDLSHDGKPDTTWNTLQYRGSPNFGNLKPGVGILFDLGSQQPLAGVTVTTTMAGSRVEIRTGDAPEGPLDAFPTAATATLDGKTKVRFPKAVTTRYVLVWVTTLVPSDGGYAANLAEVTVQHAG
jgi:tRNA A-37 threonylcarbamoyl transferase component Bud32